MLLGAQDRFNQSRICRSAVDPPHPPRNDFQVNEIKIFLHQLQVFSFERIVEVCASWSPNSSTAATLAAHPPTVSRSSDLLLHHLTTSFGRLIDFSKRKKTDRNWRFHSRPWTPKILIKSKFTLELSSTIDLNNFFKATPQFWCSKSNLGCWLEIFREMFSITLMASVHKPRSQAAQHKKLSAGEETNKQNFVSQLSEITAKGYWTLWVVRVATALSWVCWVLERRGPASNVREKFRGIIKSCAVRLLARNDNYSVAFPILLLTLHFSFLRPLLSSGLSTKQQESRRRTIKSNFLARFFPQLSWTPDCLSSACFVN